jgi:hemoglobin
MNTTPPYGTADASFQAAGRESGLTKLVANFYEAMSTEPRTAAILAVHPDHLEKSRDKLTRFLIGWLNGPDTFRPKYGPISIPRVHSHLPIGETERDASVSCMDFALAHQLYANDFKTYLLTQLRVPAERCPTQ